MIRTQGRRVAITGLGVVSGIGADLGEYRSALRNCQSGIRNLQRNETLAPKDATSQFEMLAAGVGKLRSYETIGSLSPKSLGMPLMPTENSVTPQSLPMLLVPLQPWLMNDRMLGSMIEAVAP